MNKTIIASIVLASAILPAMGQVHPFLFMNSNDIARVQANAVFDSHFAGLAQAQINIANSTVPANLPPFETDWWAEEQAKGYRGADRAVTYEHLRLVPRQYSYAARDCTRAWILSGNTNHLDKAKTILLMQSAYDFGFEDVNSGLDYAVSTLGTMEAYDMAYDRFSPSEHAQMEDFFMRLLAAVEACDDYWVDYTNGEINNHEGWHRASMGMVGFFYGLQEYIDRAISDSKGFHDMLRDGFLDEGLWNESSLPYQYVQLEAMLFTAERARYAGYPENLLEHTIAGRSLQSCFDTVFDLIFPDGMLPAIGDGYGSLFYPGGYREYEQLYTRTQDSKYAWLIDRSDARDRDSLFLGVADLSAGSVPAASSRLWQEHGYAALRSNEGSGYWNGDGWSLFSCFHNTSSHEHADKLSIMLYADDHYWIRDGEAKPDRDEPAAADITIELNRATASHNTVMIDYGSQSVSLFRPLDLLEYSVSTGEKRLTAGDAGDLLYPGVRQLRTCIVRDDYVVDVFQVKVDQPHEISWTTHINGDPHSCFGSTFGPVTGLPADGPWAFIMADDVSAPTNRFWETFEHDGDYFRMDVATDRPAQYTRCRYPLLESDPVGSSIPMRMVGAGESNMVFVAVYRTGSSPIADPVGIEIGSAADGEEWMLGIVHQGATNEFTLRGLLAPPIQGAPVPFVDDANTHLLLHMDTTSFPDDDSANPGRNRDGYKVNGPTVTPSLAADLGNALLLDGVNQRLQIKNTANVLPTAGLRYEFWAKQDMVKGNDDSYHYLFLQAWAVGLSTQDRAGGDWRLDFRVWDSLGVQTSWATTDQELGINLNDWNHFAMEIENGEMRTYINHILRDTRACPSTLQVSTRNMDIGGNYNGGQIWGGVVDEFRISSLVPPPPYDAWLGQYPGVGIHVDMLDDPDGDGRNNLQEWGFGGNPSHAGFIGHVPTLGTIEYMGDTWLEYIYARHNESASLGLAYYLEENEALTNSVGWGNANYEFLEGDPDSAGSGFTTVTNWVNTAGEDALFLRLMLEAD